MKSYSIAVIAGDGIGREVMPPALAVLEAAGRRFGFGISAQHFDWSCETYRATGAMMPADGLERLRPHDAILLGAVGYPGVPDHISLWGLLIPIRRSFDQYINLRPVRLLKGVSSPLRDAEPGSIDMLIVRENSEGEYSQVGGRLFEGTEREVVTQVSSFTRHGTDRVIRYAFDLAARSNRGLVSSATKSNGLWHSMPFWDERFASIAAEYPDIRHDQHHIDIMAARMVMNPGMFDVIVASNLFGDILSDLGPGLTGTIAIAPSANINPDRSAPSMFEPVHGSAPDIAGMGIANPIGQIWSVAMMLDHLGEADAAQAIIDAIEAMTADAGSPRTPDMNGTATTVEVGKAIVDRIGD